ncbi:MAG: tail fiber domain-containing protein [Candidatus Omnitrophota bacterium]
MNKKMFLITTAVFFSLVLLATAGFAGNVTLSTYYPAPSGNYTKLSIGSVYNTGSMADNNLAVQGNVSIGKAAVTAGNVLDVVGIINSDNYITGQFIRSTSGRFETGSNNNILYLAPFIGQGSGLQIDGPLQGGVMHFFTGTSNATQTETMRLDANGNLGIGSALPSTKLDVAGNIKNSGTVTAGLGFFATLGGVNVSSGGVNVTAGGVNVTAGGVNVTAGGITASAGDVTVIGGNLGVGSATPGAKLDVAGNSNLGTAGIANTATVNGTLNVTTALGTATLTTTKNYTTNYGITNSLGPDPFLAINLPVNITGLTSIGGNNLSLILNGDIQGTGYYHSSDERLKQDIKPISAALRKINAINGVTYTFKTHPGKTQMGLIAQNVEKVAPEVVATDAKGMKSVEYGNLVGLLVEGIKAQQKQLDAQQKQINELKARLKTIEKK